MVGHFQVTSTLGNPAVAAVNTISAASKQTQIGNFDRWRKSSDVVVVDVDTDASASKVSTNNIQHLAYELAAQVNDA